MRFCISYLTRISFVIEVIQEHYRDYVKPIYRATYIEEVVDITETVYVITISF